MKLVYGVAFNDADYATQTRKGNTVWCCPFYRTWIDMVRRVYCDKHKAKRPTYDDCKLHNEWHSFTNFKMWMEKQDWQGNELDKDLLVKGNKLYSADTCVFISKAVNLFMTEANSNRGKFPIGVSFHKATGKYMVRVRNLGKGQRYLGVFKTPEEAHMVYRKAKFEHAIELSNVQTNENVANALLSRYSLESMSMIGE